MTFAKVFLGKRHLRNFATFAQHVRHFVQRRLRNKNDICTTAVTAVRYWENTLDTSHIANTQNRGSMRRACFVACFGVRLDLSLSYQLF